MATPERLLVLYTGGTIGMQMSADGLAPASGFEARMRDQQAREDGSELPQWQFRELLPLIDSANMNPGHWLALRDLIVEAVEAGEHDAVLVLHGTDTLAYSAAALSFLLLGFNVPVVLTGAMQPAGVEGGDAWPNLFGAMRALHRGVKPGVHLFFDGHLLHGARCSKLRSDAFDAFQVLPRERQAERAAITAAGPCAVRCVRRRQSPGRGWPGVLWRHDARGCAGQAVRPARGRPAAERGRALAGARSLW